MNQPEITGSLASGRTFRVTGYLLEVSEPDGRPAARISGGDVRSVHRDETRVTIERLKGGPLYLDGATPDDAGRLELGLRAVMFEKGRREGIARKGLIFGCGGVALVLFVAFVSFFIFAVSRSVSKATGPQSNVAIYQPGATAQTHGFAMTLQTIDDPWSDAGTATHPQQGNKFIRYHVVAKESGKGDTLVNPSDFRLTTGDNHAYGASDNGAGLWPVDLLAGQVTEGDVIFEVPAGASVTNLTYNTGPLALSLVWRPQ